MSHQHVSQPPIPSAQTHTVIERVNEAMRKLDQLIHRTHQLSAGIKHLTEPFHKSV